MATTFSPFGTSLFGHAIQAEGGALQTRWLIPPFSVFDMRQGYWQKRKKAWIALGIKSELGRGENIVPNGSVRDPKNDGAWQRGYANTNPLGLSSQKGRGSYTKGKPEGLTWTGQVAEFDHYRRIEKGRPLTFNPNNEGGDPLTWQTRKKHTASLKGGLVFNMTPGPYDQRAGTEEGLTSGTSIFDPALCEIMYTWFAPPRGMVLDPFAGGSVRGVVATLLGRSYLGYDLSPLQVDANRDQAVNICGVNRPQWIVDDALHGILALPSTFKADFLFTCPPYGSLEKYSNDPADLSTLSEVAFNDAYEAILASACARLRDNRFAAIVVGDYRRADGTYAAFPGVTIDVFVRAGLRLYNQAVLITMVGSLPVRTSAQFPKSRKLGNGHQHVLIFVKGDPKAASDAIGE